MAPRKKHDARTPGLYWREDRGLYYVTYRHPATPRTRSFVSTGTADRTVALEKLAVLTKKFGAVDLGLLALPTARQARTTVGACLELLEARYRREGFRSLKPFLCQAAHARRELGAVPVDGLTLPIVNAARDRLTGAHNLAKGTVNRIMDTVRTGINLALEGGTLVRGLGFKWPRFSEKEFKRQTWVTLEELARVNAAEYAAAVRDMNTWAFWTGMRHLECASLTWDAWDPRTFTLRLFPEGAKTGEPRVYPLPPGQLRALLLRRWQDRRPDCPLVFHIEGQWAGKHDRWSHAWARAGLPMVRNRRGNLEPQKTFHDMRRVGVRSLTLAGVPEKQAMLVSGHKSRRIFDDYNITDERQIRAALVAVTRYHGRQPVGGDPVKLERAARRRRAALNQRRAASALRARWARPRAHVATS